MELDDFNPESNMIDNMILYQVTGTRHEGDHCNFTCSSDEDVQENSDESGEKQQVSIFKRKTTKKDPKAFLKHGQTTNYGTPKTRKITRGLSVFVKGGAFG